MNGSRVAADSCPNCAAGLPKAARFCPACGAQIDAGATVPAHVPPDETGPVPVTVQRSEPRWFGVAPPQLLLALAVIAFVLSLILFAVGHWPYGLMVLGVAALLLAAFLEAAWRRPDSSLTRASVDARERARSSWQTLRARQAAAAEVRRVQGALLLLDSERKSALQELGGAVHAGDAAAETSPRARLAELDARETQLRGELDEALGAADEQIRKARLPVQETEIVPPTED
jgi:hypothetical protein